MVDSKHFTVAFNTKRSKLYENQNNHKLSSLSFTYYLKPISSGLDVWKMIGCHDDRFDLAPKSNYNYYFAWNWDLAPIYIIVFFADKCWYLGRRVEVLIGNLRYIFNIRALFFVLFCFFFYVICFRILQISKE